MELIVIVPNLAVAVACSVSISLNEYYDNFVYQLLLFCIILIVTCVWDLHLAGKMRKGKKVTIDKSAAVESAQLPTDISIIGLNDVMHEKYLPPIFEESSSPAIIQIPLSQVILIK